MHSYLAEIYPAKHHHAAIFFIGGFNVYQPKRPRLDIEQSGGSFS